MRLRVCRRGFVAAASMAVAWPALAQRTRGLWFDPTQLPSYSGRLERWLINPAGETDRGLFREGSQFVFPPADADDLTGAIQPGGPLTVWGIRARSAPVITMLAWAKSDAEPANFVARPAWFASTARGTQRLAVAGQIAGPLLSPQGDAMGVLLANGDSLRLAPGVHAALGERLDVGGQIAAEGLGTRRGTVASIDAARIGPNAESLAPLPEPRP
jgi:hypothetical protein